MEKFKIANRGRTPHEHSLWGSALRGMIGAMLLSLALLLLFSFIAYKSADPTRSINTWSYITLAVASLFCGFFAAASRKKPGILSGISAGVLFLSAVIIISFFFKEGAFSFTKSLLMYIAILILSTLGGLFGGRSKKQRRHLKRQ